MPTKPIVKAAMIEFFKEVKKKGTIQKAYLLPEDGGLALILTKDPPVGATKVKATYHANGGIVHIEPSGSVSGLEKILVRLTNFIGGTQGITAVTSIAPANDAGAPASAGDDAQSASSSSTAATSGDAKQDKIKSALNLRFSKWLNAQGNTRASDDEMKLRKGFSAAMQGQKWAVAKQCLDALEKLTAENTYAAMPDGPSRSDDNDDNSTADNSDGKNKAYAAMPDAPAGGDDSAGLRDDDNDKAVDSKVRDDLLRQFVNLQTRIKKAEAGIADSLHADKNRTTLTKLKALLEKVRGMLKKKAFDTDAAGNALGTIEENLKTIESETSNA